MSDRHTVIYTARNMQEAYLLRNFLAEVGIVAVVENELLERGSGVDFIGLPTAAKVAVAEDDAERAREIALAFDRQQVAAARVAQQDTDEETASDGPSPTAMVGAPWPECPQCGKLRITRCPICHTAGNDFPPVDMGFIVMPSADDDQPQQGSCSCGPGGCSPAKGETAADETVPGETDDMLHEDDMPQETLLMCTTCDEPFTPQYAGECEWCNHVFPDGYEVERADGIVEHVDTRVVAVATALLVLTVAGIAYFLFVL